MRFYFTEQLSDKLLRTPEGFLICKDVIIARTGGQLYTAQEMPIEPDGNGFVHVFRLPEEVFKPESIASFAGKPFVIEHPTEDGMIVDVTPENWRDVAVGTVLSPRRGTGVLDDVLMADFLVTDELAIEEILSNRKREVSCGYDADYVQIGPGQAKQVNIIGNHVALVQSGRCGPKCRIYDSKPKEIKKVADEIKTVDAAVAKPTNWITDIINRAFKARDAGELLDLGKEAEAKAAETSESGGDHTHIHLHPHSGGDNTMQGAPSTHTAPAAPAAPQNAPLSGDAVKKVQDDVAALQQGHQMLSQKLDMICEALGIDGEDGGEGGEVDPSGGNPGFGDEANLARSEPHYARKPNQGIYEPGDYREGSGIEMDHPGEINRRHKAVPRGFGAEAPTGSSGAEYAGTTGDRRRKAGDAAARLQDQWQDMIADAEIIIPGVRIPTVDSKHPVNVINTMCGFRRRVLNHISQDLEQGTDLESITRGSDLRRMTCDSVTTTFRALAAMYRDRNNQASISFAPAGSVPGARQVGSVNSLSDLRKRINDHADEIWGSGGSTR